MVALGSQSPQQRQYLTASVAQFWDALDRMFAMAADGRHDEARAQIRVSLVARQAALTTTDEQDGDGAVVFALDVEPPECGQFRTEVRIYPWHELLSHPYELGLMKWL